MDTLKELAAVLEYHRTDRPYTAKLQRGMSHEAYREFMAEVDAILGPVQE